MAKEKKATVSVRDLEQQPDIWFVHNANAERVYYHAEDDPMRIRQLEIKGYTVCTDDEVKLSESYMAMANKGGSGPLNNPGHILMWTSRENHERLETIKDARLARHEQDVKDKVDSVKAIIERKGLGRVRGGIKGDLEFDM